jgi:5-methylcytosine-specific restriction endonuclease McrA
MHKIPFLNVNDEEIFDKIAAAKQQPRKRLLATVRAKVLTAYHDYNNAAPEVGNLANVVLTEPQMKALVHAFEVETAPMVKLRGDLLNRVEVARCPFCGLSESSTLDHYLPKELNPQFAIFTKNLVPSCSLCNTRKRDKVLDEQTNIRIFLHPYFDDIPSTQFMHVKITLLLNAIIIRYALIRPAGMVLSKFKHLQSHFRHLGLADRYRLMALEHLRGQYRGLARMYGTAEDASRVAEGLIEKANDYEEEYGKNYWLTILYHALAAHEAFCDGGFDVLKRIQ